MYILSKAKPPMDVDFMVSDTFELLRPKMHIFSTYEEANAEVDLILLEQLKTVQSKYNLQHPKETQTLTVRSPPSIDKDEKVQEDGFEESDGSDTSSDEENEDDRIGDLDKEDEEIESADEVDWICINTHTFTTLTLFSLFRR